MRREPAPGEPAGGEARGEAAMGERVGVARGPEEDLGEVGEEEEADKEERFLLPEGTFLGAVCPDLPSLGFTWG